LKFGDGMCFKSAGFGLYLVEDTTARVRMTKQLPKDKTTEALKSVTSVITGIIVVLALATPFLSVALGNLKHMIEGLQVILYFPMMYVMAPSNLGVLQKVVMLIVTFEIVPGDLYQNYIWFWTEEESLSPRLEAVGLDSRIFMLSMGLPFYLFAIALVLLVVALVMECCVAGQAKDEKPEIDE